MSARAALLSVLAEAASQEQYRMKTAVDQLQQWETTPQFYSTLQDIFYDKSVDTNIRWQAIIYLKNGIDKYWRKSAKNAIAAEEKAAIRSRLLTALDEEQKPLATQNAVLISKIARIDFPLEWPDLLNTMLEIVCSSTANESDPRARLVQQRSLYTLHLIVKGLISKTLAAGRKQFQQVAPELFSNIVNIYVRYVDQLFASSTTNIESLSGSLETSRMALKCLRRVMVHGFPEFSTSEGPVAFFGLALEHLQKFMTFKDSIPEQCSFLVTAVDSHIKLIGKFYLDLLDVHPRQFILTPGAGNVLRFYWGLLAGKSDQGPTMAQTTLIQGLLMIKRTLKDPQFNLSDKDPEPVVIQCRHIIENEFMTPETTVKLAEILITKYMRLTEDDLEEWDSNPEAWALEEEADSWKYQIRPCAEKVFMDLLSSRRAQLSPLLVQLAGSTAQMSDVSLKDSIYCAIGLGSHDLYDSVDFDSWLNGQLSQDIQNTDPSYRVIRRRIAWMIGKWVSVNVSKAGRPVVYTIMLHLLRPEEHLAVRLAAAQNLKACIDDWDFEPTTFAPYLEQCVQALRLLMGEVEEADSRMKILDCMSIIVERMEEHITPYAQHIIELLPPLWQAATNQNLLQSAILVIMTKLVESLKSQSVGLHALVMPLIRLSVDPSQEAHIYLMEDGFELWLATLKTALQATDELLSLVPAAVALLAEGLDHMRTMLKILQSYLLLDAARTFQIAGAALVNGIAGLLGDGLKSEASISIMQFMDTTALTCPLSNTGELYISSGLLNKVLSVIMAKQETNVVLTQYLCFIARLALDDAGYLSNAINNAGQQFGQVGLLGIFVEFWMEKFDNVSHPKFRKLHAMGLTAMIRTSDPSVLNSLPRLVAIWGDVLNEVNENGAGDSLVYWRETQDYEDETSEETAEVLRRRELLKRDPVHTTNLAHYVKASILECERLNGGVEPFRQQWLSKVDPLMLDDLTSLLG